MSDDDIYDLKIQTMRETLLRAAEMVESATQVQLDAARAGVVERGRSLKDATSITLIDVAAANLRLAARRIE